MRKLFFLSVIPVLLVACASSPPKIALETDHFDFGELVNGVIVTRELAIRNEGEAPLVIEAVSTSCGCTKASVETTTIAPGSATTLKIEYDSGAHGPELTGSLVRQIFIASNDPEQPEVIVEFDSFILPPESS